ncbi:RES domain-containing protein [Algoriphagus taiwanensis]|uniref:RES domain-containing protein n=1 Tax=Algoriphagus taiwanensis TaxID=1445656 RepID=A0ABQ6Q1G4_9BACT|nr:hypothetical protein Ataiwa_22940 [Algoriphagus taiwanensis]
MDCLEIKNEFQILHKAIEIPKINSDSDYFDCLRTGLEKYVDFIDHLFSIKRFQEIHVFKYPENSLVNLQKDIKQICNSIIEVLKLYLDGRILKSNNLFSEKLIPLYNVDRFHSLTFLEGKKFYRIVELDRNEVNKEINELRLFHPPFHLRSKISSCRFSINGFPTLYLGESLDICAKEVGINLEKNYAGVLLLLKRPIKVIQFLSPKDFSSNYLQDELSLHKIPNYLFSFPLIVSSLIRCYKDGDSFKPEYIIPQMVLSYIRDHKNFDGIMFPSTRAVGFPEKFGKYNFALPVKSFAKEGYCKDLLSCFTISKPELITATFNSLKAYEEELYTQKIKDEETKLLKRYGKN